MIMIRGCTIVSYESRLGTVAAVLAVIALILGAMGYMQSTKISDLENRVASLEEKVKS